MKNNRLVIVGQPQPFHVGAHFLNAARSLGLEVELLDASAAYAGPAFLRRLSWWLRGRRPLRLRRFTRRVVATCQRLQPAWLLTTGLAPVTASGCTAIRHLGARCLNFLTDDPWNRAHRAPWFFDALRGYDGVFTPRTANLEDLKRHGCARVSYLPFAYSPEVHFPEPPRGDAQARLSSDVLFVGGADADRWPLIKAFIHAGVRLALYGGYWDRYAEARPFYRGHADLPTLRQATAAAKTTLCLVRRANRDGHCMRTFEAPALGGCLLVEDTTEHRELFGNEGDAVAYFSLIPNMLAKAKSLMADDARRAALAQRAHALITQGAHSYRHRLETMLGESGGDGRLPRDASI
jgi:hypothetical protein